MSLYRLHASYISGKITKQEYIRKMHKNHMRLFEYMQFIKNTDITKIEISDNRLIFTSRKYGVKMFIDTKDSRTTPIEILNFGAFEKNDFPMLLKLVDKGSIVFDIGANIGWVSISIAKAVKDYSIFAFEPIKTTFQRLNNNIKINKIKNIKTFNFGFSNEEKEQMFYFNPNDSGSASLANITLNENVQEIKGSLRKLDFFVKESKIRVDFIKCDVEGAEILIFKGGLDTIKINKPIIFVEMLRKWTAKFSYHPNDTIALLKRLGYNCYITQDDKLVQFSKMDEQTVQTNFFFLHKSKHSKKIYQYVKKM